MQYDYEYLLKWIYGISDNNDSSHLRHGAQANIYYQALECRWNFEEIDKKIAEKSAERNEEEDGELPTLQDAFNAGENTAEVSVFLAEAIQYAMEHQCKDDAEKQDVLSKLYIKASGAKSINDIDEVIMGAYSVLGLA